MAGPTINRRAALGRLGIGGLALLAGCSADGSGDGGGLGSRERSSCVPAGDLERFTTLAGLPLVYEVNQRRSGFRIDAGFARQLGAWLDRLPADGLDADQLWTYGAWIDGRSAGCDSWHHAGRALDVARVRRPDATFVSARYDRWRTESGAALDRARREYWALAAGLHRDFAYVLTYLYDDVHHNHIHVDNGRSGATAPTFSTRSGVQVQAVQAICSYLWSTPVEITGGWDGATRTAVGRVLDSLGAPDDLTAPAAWAALMTASAKRY